MAYLTNCRVHSAILTHGALTYCIRTSKKKKNKNNQEDISESKTPFCLPSNIGRTANNSFTFNANCNRNIFTPTA